MTAVEQIEAKLLEKYTAPENIELVKTSILYVSKKIAEKENKNGQWVAKYNFDAGWLLQTIAECIDNGFALDGVNYVITGNRMFMPTYKAYKNKVYMVYPESVIDLQLIREGDKYHFEKKSGQVIYSHEIGDPFTATEPNIIGAYCVIKNSRGEFLETLNATDYQKMKDNSKTPSTWAKWPSEFWKKSVIRRACKTHFNDITKSLDEQDNKAVGLEEVVKASTDKKKSIIEAKKAENNADSDNQTQAE